jgi:signal transduction histidine kinase
LIGIEERVHALQGKVAIKSLRNQGTVVDVEIPVGVPA